MFLKYFVIMFFIQTLELTTWLENLFASTFFLKNFNEVIGMSMNDLLCRGVRVPKVFNFRKNCEIFTIMVQTKFQCEYDFEHFLQFLFLLDTSRKVNDFNKTFHVETARLYVRRFLKNVITDFENFFTIMIFSQICKGFGD